MTCRFSTTCLNYYLPCLTCSTIAVTCLLPTTCSNNVLELYFLPCLWYCSDLSVSNNMLELFSALLDLQCCNNVLELINFCPANSTVVTCMLPTTCLNYFLPCLECCSNLSASNNVLELNSCPACGAVVTCLLPTTCLTCSTVETS